MYDKMQGKIDITIGAGSGIDRATVQIFARESVKVVVADGSEEGGFSAQ